MTENVFTLVHQQNQKSDRTGNARAASLRKVCRQGQFVPGQGSMR